MVTEVIDGSMIAMYPFFLFGGIALVIAVCAIVFPKNKSREYRKIMKDMFVVGKIKQLAKEEGIDLIAEIKEFAKAMRYKKLNEEALDNTIETELQMKIADSAEAKDPKGYVDLRDEI